MKNSTADQSPLAWRCVWISLLFLGIAAIFSVLDLGPGENSGRLSNAFVSFSLLAAWIVAIRFLLLRTWGRIFWLLVLVGGLVSVLSLGSGGLVLGMAMSCFFLFTRMYHPWQMVPPRRRAIAFGLGLLALAVLSWSISVWGNRPSGQSLTTIDQLGIWSLGSLLGFWFLSLFYLAVRMRLHFLRLRAKLAVNAILIGLIPMVLLMALGSYILFVVMGGSRAVRSVNVLNSWTAMVAGGNDLAGAPFDTTFAWPQQRESLSDTTQYLVEAPAWVSDLSAQLSSDQDLVDQGEITAFFLVDQEVWLMRWRELDGQNPMTTAWLLNERPLVELSRLIKAGVELTHITGFLNAGGIDISSEEGQPTENYQGLSVSYRDVSGDPSFWNPWRAYGVAFFPVTKVSPGDFEDTNILLSLGVGWADWRADFLEGDNNLNLVATFIMALFVLLFIIVELFAIFFGVRITEGFVTAVHSLHKGTRALGKGNLDTVIDIPNEDEFGDLADSFNEMTIAIRQGRDDALAKEALTLELATAREIQERLLPSEEPTLVGFEITGASIPSREVGGDYFDFLIQDKDHVGIAIGDVSGKGMPAALLMSNLQASLHGQVIHPSSVSEVVGLVNNLIVHSTDPHMFATFFYGLLDIVQGTFTSTNAGHNPPLILRVDGSIETLNAGGLLLGMLEGQEYKQETVTLDPGDVVVLYTDGITEAVGPGIDEDDVEAMFGEEALEKVVRANCHLPAVGIKEAILDAVSRHTEGVAQSDDITLVVIRRQG